MAIKNKNGVNAENATPEQGNGNKFHHYTDDLPPHCGPSEEDLKNYDKNMDLLMYLMEATSKDPVVIDEDVKKILISRFEKQHVLLTGMTYAEAKVALDKYEE